MNGEILVKTLTCLLMSPLFLACWRGMINLICYLFISDLYILLNLCCPKVGIKPRYKNRKL